MYKLALLLVFATVVASINPRLKVHRRHDVRHKLFQYSQAGFFPGNPEASNPIDKMRNIEDGEYIANITFGTPAQTFSLIMDTGSANVWASGTNCDDKGCSKMHKFAYGKSSTFHNLHEPFLLVYGTGYCYGHLANDSVGVDDVTIKAQGIGVASVVAAFFEKVPDVDGIFGMGLSAIAEPPTLISPLTDMVKQGEVTAEMFGVYLDSKNDENSEITWGTIDKTKYTGELQTAPYIPFPISVMYYMTGWSKMEVNGKKVAGFDCGIECLAVVDTGTSAIVGPAPTIKKINDMLNISKDCSNKNSLPPVKLTIDFREWEIPSKVYVIEQDKQCTSGFIGTPIYQGFWIFGDPFLRTVYTVFDNKNKRFHFGKSVGPSQL